MTPAQPCDEPDEADEGEVVELIADRHLRTALGLADGDRIAFELTPHDEVEPEIVGGRAQRRALPSTDNGRGRAALPSS